MTPLKNWSDSVYPGGSQDGRFSNGSSGKTSDGQATVNNTGYFGNPYANQKPFRVSYPTDIVLASSNLDAVKNYKIRLGYDRTLAGSPDKTLDGVFAYSTGSVKDSFNNKTVTVNNSNMMAAFDKVTGDVLNYEKVDYTTDGGQTWVKGVAANQVPSNGVSRVNHAYTLSELNGGGALAAAVKDSNGYYTAVYLKSGSGDFAYSNLLGKVSGATGIDGLYIQTGSVTLSKDSSSSLDLFKYDGSTDISQVSKKEVKLSFYCGNHPATGSLKVTVADDGNRGQFNSAYDSLNSYIKNYRPSDFKDYDKASGSSATYDAATAALAAGFEARQSPLNLSTAGTLSSAFAKTPVTSEVKTVIGEPATKPVTSLDQLPAALAAYATTDGNYYYADSAMSQLYYTTEALTDADVTGATSTNVGGQAYTTATDPTGQTVVKSGSSWYFLNAQAYATAWDTTSYEAAPYAINGAAKEGTYNQAKFVYYNANGVAVSKDFTVKHMVTEKSIVNNGSEETRALAM